MFIKTADKKDKNTGKFYHYYKLCENYHINKKTRHRTNHIINKLDEIQSDKEKIIRADCIEHCLSGRQEIFIMDVPDRVEKLFFPLVLKNNFSLSLISPEKVALIT